jgi:hypothetical protein
MNLHADIDRLVTAIGGLYGDGAKFFGENTATPPISDIISQLDLRFAPPEGGDEVRIPVSHGAITETARYRVVHADDTPVETLIYHHGSGEIDYAARLARVTPHLVPRSRRVIAVSVPDNESMRSYVTATRDLHRWTFLLASSVRLTEELVAWIRRIDGGGSTAGGSTDGHRIVCAGISLGGWVTNLHHAYFDSCDAYRPIFAGAAPDHLFTDTIYRKMLARSAGPDAGAAIRRAINFETAFAKRCNENVVACMARHDQFVRLDRQRGIYRPGNVRILEKGHITGAMAYRELAAHLGE